MPLNEYCLIVAAQAGDNDAWTRLIARYRPLLMAAVRVAVRRNRDADDALSWALETLMKCVRRFDPRRGVKLTTYLCRSIPLAVKKGAANRGGIHVPANGLRRHPAAVSAARTQSIYSPSLRSGVLEVPARPEATDDRRAELDVLVQRLSHTEQEYVRRRRAGETHDQLSRSLRVHAWKYEQSIIQTLRRHAANDVAREH